ncbi:MAG: AI-2E family transporter [Bacteroidales bacterium]|nr:MAG: AI-2E family transporter [Bacteroidales bacterium]
MTTSSSSIIKKLLILFLVIAGLYYAKVFLMPLAIGGILATLFLPLCKWLEGKKVPKGLAAISCLLAFLITLSGIGILLGWQISELASDFSNITEKAIDTGNRIQEFIFNNFNISLKEQSQILKKEQPSITGIMQKVVGSLTYVLTNFILVLVYIFLLLYYRNHIRRFIVKLTPPSQQNEMEQVLNSITNVSQQYLLGLAKMIVCLWIMYGIGFSIIGVKNALFFAIICGLLEIVPFIGNIIGTSLTLLVAAANGASLTMLILILSTYLVVQAIQGWLLSPLIVGPQVKINPFTTIVVLIVGNLIWGVPGIFIAIPLIAMIKIVCDHIDQLKPYGFLIGEIEKIKEEPDFVKKIKSRFIKKIK